MFVDSHVNLHHERFAGEVGQVIETARRAGVSAMLNICCDIDGFDAVLAVAEQGDHIWASVGTHPHEAHKDPDISPSKITVLSRHPKVIGIGETGLDFHYNYSERADQIKNFMAHIEAVRETGLPLIIHTREADREMGDILESEMKKGPFPALLHCYSSGAHLAARAAEMGCYFSLSGILTFKNAKGVRQIAKTLPDERIMIETDCPYLAPVPYRGRRNEPAYVIRVAEALAELKGWSLEETARRTTKAFYDLFKKATPPT